MRYLMFVIAFLAGCDGPAGAALCDKGDYACTLSSFDRSDVRGAVEYMGPCYRFAREVCDKAEFCTGALLEEDDCVDWFVDEVCLQPAGFDPDKMNACSEWAQQVDCEFFFDANYAEDNGFHFTCPDLYPHPLAGKDGWDDVTIPGPPPGA